MNGATISFAFLVCTPITIRAQLASHTCVHIIIMNE